jgi:hypothetical protein
VPLPSALLLKKRKMRRVFGSRYSLSDHGSFWIMGWLRVDYAEGQVFALYEILGCGRKGFLGEVVFKKISIVRHSAI